MQVFSADVYEAYTNSDLTEGRGADILLGYFKFESDARAAVRGRGPMGTDGDVRPKHLCIKIYESFNEYNKNTRAEVAKRAYERLSPEEREALGLTTLPT